MKIKVEHNQLLEMAAAFGVRRFGAALVVLLGSTDFSGEGREWNSYPINATESKLTTKAAPSSRTPKAPPIYEYKGGPMSQSSRATAMAFSALVSLPGGSALFAQPPISTNDTTPSGELRRKDRPRE
ncbi:MAG TPA: hypothetical protein VFY40_17600 [Blastocatellia bacterium]|nr:hypothetical protein [Blastocatellia bacterium]